MATTSLPRAVLVAGAAMCLLAGYVLGMAIGAGSPERDTGVVESYDAQTDELCLGGGSVSSAEGADGDLLCGTWRRGSGSSRPREGEDFRFVSIRASDDPDDDEDPVRVLIYGDVVAG